MTLLHWMYDWFVVKDSTEIYSYTYGLLGWTYALRLVLISLCLCLDSGITMTHNLVTNTSWEDLNTTDSSTLQEGVVLHQNVTFVDFYLHKSSVAAIFTISYLLIFLTCMVGNSVVCFIVLRSKNMRTVTNIFILNLAISDLLVGIFCMPTTLVDNIITGVYVWVWVNSTTTNYV